MIDQDRNACLQQAIQMEKEGKEFYKRAAANVANPAVRLIFEELARQEDFHIQKIEEIYTGLEKAETLKEWVTCVISDSKVEALFANGAVIQAAASASDVEALNFAAGIEEKSVKYYDDAAAQTKDKYEKRFYLALAHEERGHYLWLIDSIELLTNPEGWNYIKGRGMVDGG